MRRKRQEFMDLKQDGRFMHDYSKLFSHLAQYAPDQVGTNHKKRDHFMIDLSTKLQECTTLNTGGSFSEFVSNVIITNNAICAHKETKKRKAMTAPSGSAPQKYRMVYHHCPTHQHQQHHRHHRQQQQWAPRAIPPPPTSALAPRALPPPPSVMYLPAPLTVGATFGHVCFNCG
jgi:hypothetical protein